MSVLTIAACLSGKLREKAFDSMNGIAANMLLHLTSSVRFEGPLNVDLNEITTNLVPFPRLHFLLASLSPLAAPKDLGKLVGAPRMVDQVAARHCLEKCTRAWVMHCKRAMIAQDCPLMKA